MQSNYFFTCDSSVYAKQITSLTQRFKYGFIGTCTATHSTTTFYVAFNSAKDLAIAQGFLEDDYKMLETLQVGQKWTDGCCYSYIRVW